MNGFWLYLLLSGLLIPCLMIVFGIVFARKVPKNINIWYGYRTARSMKNEDTWQFAHRHLGRSWRVAGGILLVVSVLPMIAVVGRDDDTVGLMSLLITAVQLVVMIASIVPTERALKKTFDDQGNRK